MEGKGLLFKIFADIDVFDIEIDETDTDKFIQTAKLSLQHSEESILKISKLRNVLKSNEG